MSHLPPLMALRALEAAERLHSYSLAAEELSVTHGAISHQIRRLEGELGVPLFQRRGNGMEPLPAATRLAFGIKAGLALLERAVEESSANQVLEPLVLSVEQGFARKWLASRFDSLRTATGGRDLDIRLENRLADLVGDGVDAAIRFGDGQWPGFEVSPLFKVRFFPVCSPDFPQLHRLRCPADLLAVPLLRHTHPLWSWPAWFRSLGLAAPPDQGIRFDDSSLMLDAAANGVGVALGRSNLVQSDLLSRRLIRPLSEEVDSASGYFLVWRAEGTKVPRILMLRDWLLRECALDSSTADSCG
jgi:LysR family glycine cleavage system transcriptional activator